MRLTMGTRDEILRMMAEAYKKATKKEKGRMLDRVVEVAGYNRAYASYRLCLYGKRLFLRGAGGRQMILEAERKKPVKRHGRKGIYGPQEVCIMNDLYDVLRLYVNFFQPSAKLVSKERIGPKVIKHYDKPKMPNKRLLESSCVDEATNEARKAADREPSFV